MPAGKGSPGTKPWYADGLRFTCHQCHRCCRGSQEGWVYASRREIARVARWLGMSDTHFKRQFLTKDPDSETVFQVKANGDCIFWKDGCTIYPVRPRQCRTFPFWPENLASPEAWEAVEQHCQGAGRGRLYRLGGIRAVLHGRGTS